MIGVIVFLHYRLGIDDADGKVISRSRTAVVFGVRDALVNFVSCVAFIAILFLVEDNFVSRNKAFTLQILLLKAVVGTCLNVTDFSTVVKFLTTIYS